MKDDEKTTPAITIDGKKIEPAAPKGRVWFTITEYERNVINDEKIGLFQSMVHVICVAFGRDDITEDIILDKVDLADIQPLYNSCVKWLNWILNSKPFST